MFKKMFFAAMTAVALAGGTATAADAVTSSNASYTWQDTSVAASDAHVSNPFGSFTASDTGASPNTVQVSGAESYSLDKINGSLSGITVSSSGVISGTATGLGDVYVFVTDSDGNVAVEGFAVTESSTGLVTTSASPEGTMFSDSVLVEPPSTNNTNGTVTLNAKSEVSPAPSTTVVPVFSASNLPTGLSVTSNMIDPGTAAPGTYNYITETATDQYGAVTSSKLTLIVTANKIFSNESAIGRISNWFSGRCLDNSNFTWVSGNPLQQWLCGAAGSADQNFQLVDNNGTTNLLAIAPAGKPQGPWCVTANTIPGSKQLTIQACGNGVGNQVVEKHGPYYEFPGTGQVMDNKAFGKWNGNPVLGFEQNGGQNQKWSMP